MKKLLSVIIPVYGTEKYLERCLNSIINQIYDNIEIIIVDDCSPDKSNKIIQKYCMEYPRMYCVRHETNRGLFQARLTGAKHAHGEYITFLDSDDYVSLDYYYNMMQEATKNNYDIIANATVRELPDGTHAQYVLHARAFPETPLFNDEVKNNFFGQEGACYAWHTIWNKIYKRSLWDICEPYYCRLTQHIIMTEDIAYSSLLMYYAKSFKAISSGVYYYCINQTAVTSTNNISIEKFEKNIYDMIAVFDFVDDFLNEQNAEPQIKLHFHAFRGRYHQMWKASQECKFPSGINACKAQKLLKLFQKEVVYEFNEDAFYFDSILADWNAQLEKGKEAIHNLNIDIISFDIFDTLLLRPVWNPEDMFILMQKKFEDVCPEWKKGNFKELRIYAERLARQEIVQLRKGYEDVTLSEIYDTLEKHTGISSEVVRVLKEYEEIIEYDLSYVRKTGKELFEYAKACGKKIILISDMYLEKKTIYRLLDKQGYKDFDAIFLSSDKRVTKYTGHLFDEAIRELNVSPERIMHVGDNWDHDIVMAKKKGIKTFFLPKAKEQFSKHENLLNIGCNVGGALTTREKMYSLITYRSMEALIANKIFDNPFRPWVEGSDFNADPYIIGYVTVGMHLIGISKWLSDFRKKENVSNIAFLARDGYIPMKAFQKLMNYLGDSSVTTNYVACSRKALMPWIIENENGLYYLPIQFNKHTPLSVGRLLGCSYKNITIEELKAIIQENGFIAEKKFSNEYEFFAFINWFKENLFSTDALEESKLIVSKYYKDQIPPKSCVFDLGYSGRILEALQKCLGYEVFFMYIHHDNKSFYERVRKNRLNVKIMYDFVPAYSDLIREFFLSEQGNSCLGLKQEGENVVPIFDESKTGVEEHFTLKQIQIGAFEFIEDFCNKFYELRMCLPLNEIQLSMPFEGMIHNSSYIDRNALSCCNSEDSIYGNRGRIKMSDFWKEQQVIGSNVVSNTSYENIINFICYNRNKFEKVILYSICDRKTLKEKIKRNLSGHPYLLSIMKKTYKSLKLLVKRKER